MKKLMIFTTLLVVALTACSSKKEGGKNLVEFEKMVVSSEKPSETEAQKLSYEINFTCPSGFRDQKVLEKLKQNFIKNTFGEESLGLPLDKVIDAIVAEWKEECADVEAQCMRGMSDTIVYVSDELLQYTVCTYEFNGGSNVSQASCHLLSLQTGDEYTQADIFNPQSANDIRKLITSQIPSEGIDPDWDMELIWAPETNFSISDKGILIEYNNYELGTYRCPEKILLSYKQILPYLKKGTPVYTLATAHK